VLRGLREASIDHVDGVYEFAVCERGRVLDFPG